MGMFDNIKCKYPLPVERANDLDYQTKDTPAQFLDLYEIREDGTLWHESYDVEDNSEGTKWEAANPDRELELPEEMKGLSRLIGCMTRVNQRWEEIKDFTGEICFYTTLLPKHSGWIEWSAYFENGKVVRMNLIKHDIHSPDCDINDRNIENIGKPCNCKKIKSLDL